MDWNEYHKIRYNEESEYTVQCRLSDHSMRKVFIQSVPLGVILGHNIQENENFIVIINCFYLQSLKFK